MSNILNAVEGLDIDKLVSIIKDEVTGEEKKYMPVQNRVLWFRSTNPFGKIVTNILEKNEAFAIVEARVYLSKDDDDKNYIAKGIAQRHFSKDSIYATRNIEWAETAAIGRALSLAGFGTQFCSDELNDNGLVDSPVSISDNTNTNESAKTNNAAQTKATTNSAEQSKATAKSNSDKKTAEASQNKVPDKEPAPSTSNNEPVNTTEKELKEKSIENQENSNKPTYTKLTSVNEILNIMTLEDAENTVLDIGPLKGNSMKYLLDQDEDKVRWFVNSYAGNNNIIKAAAQILINNLDQQKAS